MKEDKIIEFHQMAKRHARKHSATRCGKAGDGCFGCTVRHCELRSMARAYMAGAIDGWDGARRELAGMPWDEAVRELASEALAAMGGEAPRHG